MLLTNLGDLYLVDFGVCKMVENVEEGDVREVIAGSVSSNLLRDPAEVIVPALGSSMLFSSFFPISSFLSSIRRQ